MLLCGVTKVTLSEEKRPHDRKFYRWRSKLAFRLVLTR